MWSKEAVEEQVKAHCGPNDKTRYNERTDCWTLQYSQEPFFECYARITQPAGICVEVIGMDPVTFAVHHTAGFGNTVDEAFRNQRGLLERLPIWR